MMSKGVDEPFSSICVNHGSPVKVHKDAHNKCDSVNFALGVGDYNEGVSGSRMTVYKETAFERNCQAVLCVWDESWTP